MSVADPHKLILTGENPFLRMSDKDGDPNSTDASFWRILFCPAGPGHVLYIKSELTHAHWRIYSDNIAMARWLQQTVQGMLNPELKDVSIPVVDAQFSKSGDPRYYWTEHVKAHDTRAGAHLVRHRRAAADPHRTQPAAQSPALRRLHRAGPGAERPADLQRPAGARQAVAARARGPALQHLGAGLFGELDRAALISCWGRATARGVTSALSRAIYLRIACAAKDRATGVARPAAMSLFGMNPAALASSV